MRRKKGKHYWNYRIVTKIIPGTTCYGNGTVTKLPDERIFSIVEVYYNGDIPDSYADTKGILYDHEYVEDLKWAYKKIKKAFKKDILDLDHWPKPYIPNSDLRVTSDLKNTCSCNNLDNLRSCNSLDNLQP
jgi:hypothetical protein